MKDQGLLFELNTLTPLMEQYYSMKAKHPDAILLYRVGDFYETFGEDAVKTSQILSIVLTKRNNGGSDIELAGFPFHALDAYLPKLVRAGYRVAICEQLEKPTKGKKVLKRGITDVITPGITTDEKLLDFKKNNFLAALNFGAQQVGLALADVSTGEFLAAEGPMDYIQKVVQNFQPAEIILPKSQKLFFESVFGDGFYTYTLEDWIFQFDFARDKLLRHFQMPSLKGFGIENLENGQIAAGAILQYLEMAEARNPVHLASLRRLSADEFVWMDKFTVRNLELVEPLHPEGKSLLQILDRCLTPMGTRLLRKYIVMPLVDIQSIQQRLSAVEAIFNDEEVQQVLSDAFQHFGDLERLISKIPLHKINPRELNHTVRSLRRILPVRSELLQHHNPSLKAMGEKINSSERLCEMVERQLDPEAPSQTNKGGIIKHGFNKELDELRYVLTHSKDLLLDIQKAEATASGIPNLKIGYNSVFGYFLEVTNKYKNQGGIPSYWIRKQTMSNGERYVTDELKKLETKILGAEERILQLEEELFQQLIESLQEFVLALQQNAQAVAELDVLLCFAQTARAFKYSKPQIDDSQVIDIKQGRHPVIEQQLPKGHDYIPNDVYLDTDEQQILMITGPNMSGKSALLRQTALISLMAQIGSYVPAKEARLGIIDKLFTRVGASDNISSGESTFMVEMNETASILNNLSNRSLLLLDEIGRGTSTYDGISIAWSIAEFIHEHPQYKAKTLFATHYHELNELETYLPRIKNFHIATREYDKKVVFLRKLIPGGSEHSFGIHVATMAGMPEAIIQRAKKILEELEAERTKHKNSRADTIMPNANKINLQIFDSNNARIEAIMKELKELDPKTMTPIECLLKIIEWKENLSAGKFPL